MHRLLLLLLMAVLAGAGAWLILQRSGAEHVPMTRLIPATPIDRPAQPVGETGPGPHGPAAAMPATAARSDAAPEVAPSTDLAAVLDVHVVCGPTDQPLAEVDVGITAGPSESAPIWRELRRTDRAGFARFAVPAGDQRLAQVWSGLGGEVSTQLSTREPVQVVLRIPVRCQVEGTVVDAGGRPVPGAELVLLPWFDRSSPGMPCSLRVGSSGKDGSFRIGLGTGGRLGACHGDYAPSAMHTVQPDADRSKPPNTTTLRLQLLSQPARARGLVVDAEGRPLPHAAIEFRAVEADRARAELSAPPQRTQSDRDGRFVVQHLRPGGIVYCARASGHGTTSGRFDVAAGATHDLRITMAKSCEVRGVVQDPDGTPVAGAMVWAGTDGAFDATTDWSRADGTFCLPGLPPGPTGLTARETNPREPGLARAAAATQLDLQPGLTEWVAVLDATSGPMLRGIVTDTAGSPLANWRILAQQGTVNARPARTNAAGEFRVRSIGQERFEVHVYAPDQPPTAFAMAAAHAVDAAHVVHITVDLSLLPAVVRGVVQSNQQEPLPATVACWHHELRAYARTTADKNGAFRFDRVPPGTIDLYFDHPGQAGTSKRDLTVGAGGDVDLGIVQLGAASAVSGSVTGPDGQPPAQVVITILTADKHLTAEYAAGTYRLTGVPPGKHVLHVQGTGLAAMRIPLDVAPGAEVHQDIALQAGIARKFRIDFEAGSCTWVTLMLGMPDESHTWLLGQPVRGAGKAEFVAFMAPGTYEAVVWSESEENKLQGRATVVFAPDDDSEVRIQLRPR